jgi:hypothetical protein
MTSNKPELKPFDVVVINGLWYMPHHWLIQWRGLDKGVHCVTIMNGQGEIWNPIFAGIKEGTQDGKYGHLDYYKGRSLSIYRHRDLLLVDTLSNESRKLVNWGMVTKSNSKGYDFWNQWLLGFVLGITTKANVDDETKWTCAEFPYWGLTYNGHVVTSKEETLPLPRLFRYNTNFETILDGIW